MPKLKTFLFFILFFIFLGFYGYNAISQPNKEQIISIIHQIEDMPYYPELSGDSLFWALAMEGLAIVPNLIDLLDDTTETNISVPNFGRFYTIGDISFCILTDIIHDLPIMDIFKSKKDYHIEGDLVYFEFVRYSKENRNYLKTKLHDWFVENKENLIWVKDKRKFRKVSSDWKYPTNQLPTKGYYKLK